VVLHSVYVQFILLNLILVLIRSLTKSQTFRPDWPEVGLIRVKLGPKRVETWFSRAVYGFTEFVCTNTINKRYF